MYNFSSFISFLEMIDKITMNKRLINPIPRIMIPFQIPGLETAQMLERLDIYADLVPDEDYNGFAQVYRTDEDGTVTVQIDENGVINLIADEMPSKNTTTGTPIGEVDSGEIIELGQVVLIYIKQYACDFIGFSVA